MAPHLVAFYDTLGIRRTYSRLKPPAVPTGDDHLILRGLGGMLALLYGNKYSDLENAGN